MGGMKMYTASRPLAALLAAMYAIAGALWIYFSDNLLAAISRDPAELTTYQTYKGWGYVMLSAWLVYGLIRLAQGELQSRMAHIEQVSRMLRLRDEIGRAVLHKQDLPELLASVCRSANNEFGLSLVAVGRLEAGSGQFIRLAHAGPDQLAAAFDPNPDPAGQSSIVEQLAQGRPYVCEDLGRAPAAVAGREAALAAGCRSLLVLPVLGMDELTGAIAFFADEAWYFGDEEIHWLEELAASLSLVFSSADQERRQQLAERALRESEGRAHLIFENAPDAMMLIDRFGIIRQANRSAHQMLGYAQGGLVGVTLEALLPERLHAVHQHHFQA